MHIRIRRIIYYCFLSGEVLAWLSVWSEVQMIAYGPADATATPSFLAPVKSRMVCLSDVGSYPDCPGKKAIKRMLVVAVVVPL